MYMPIFQIDISNQLQISLKLEIDISNAVTGLSNTDTGDSLYLKVQGTRQNTSSYQ